MKGDWATIDKHDLKIPPLADQEEEMWKNKTFMQSIIAQEQAPDVYSNDSVSVRMRADRNNFDQKVTEREELNRRINLEVEDLKKHLDWRRTEKGLRSRAQAFIDNFKKNLPYHIKDKGYQRELIYDMEKDDARDMVRTFKDFDENLPTIEQAKYYMQRSKTVMNAGFTSVGNLTRTLHKKLAVMYHAFSFYRKKGIDMPD